MDRRNHAMDESRSMPINPVCSQPADRLLTKAASGVPRLAESALRGRSRRSEARRTGRSTIRPFARCGLAEQPEGHLDSVSQREGRPV